MPRLAYPGEVVGFFKYHPVPRSADPASKDSRGPDSGGDAAYQQHLARGSDSNAQARVYQGDIEAALAKATQTDIRAAYDIQAGVHAAAALDKVIGAASPEGFAAAAGEFRKDLETMGDADTWRDRLIPPPPPPPSYYDGGRGEALTSPSFWQNAQKDA